MKGLVINRGASEIVVNISTVKYTGTTSAGFAGTELNKISAEDIASLETAIAAYQPGGSGGSYDEGYVDGSAAMESTIASSQASVAGLYKSKLASEDADIAAADSTDIDGQGTIFSESYSYLKTSAEMQANYNSGYTAGETAGYTSGYSAGETAGEATGKAAIATSQQPIASDYKSLLSGVDQTIAAADPTTLAGQLSIFNESYQYLNTGGSEWHCDDPLCFELAQGSTSSTVTINTEHLSTCEISYDKATWTNVPSNTTYGYTINTGNTKLYVRCKIRQPVLSSSFTCSGGNVDLSGDLRSLCELNKGEMIFAYELMFLFSGNSYIKDASRLKGHSNLTPYCYEHMFQDCAWLTAAPTLPATTTTQSCYEQMFYGCTRLTVAPDLPATTVGVQCYYHMFKGCINLTTVPAALPATTLNESCYEQMFYGCTSLTSTPTLPATTLASRCYSDMFYGCTSLTTAPALPATTAAYSCYNNMFNGCASLTTAPVLPATTLIDRCYAGMFSRCTSLTTAPALPATTAATACYSYMFYNCTSLTTAPATLANILAQDCFREMFANCTSLTTAPTLPASYTGYSYCYYKMFYGCSSLTSITIGATSWDDLYAGDWVSGVSATGTFTKPTGTSIPTGTSGIPSGWNVIDK